MRSLSKHVGVVALVLALASCSSVTSTPFEEGSTPEGTVYYLPKKLVKLTFEPPQCWPEGGDETPLQKILIWYLCRLLKLPTAPGLFEIEVLPAIPDRSKAYVVTLDHSVWRDDELEVETTPDGLLTRVAWSTEDRTPAAIVKLSETVAAAARVIYQWSVPGTQFRAMKEIPPAFEFIFDPSDRSAPAKFGKITGKQFSLWCEPLGGAPLPQGEPAAVEGVFYRRTVPYQLTIKRDEIPILTEIVAIPNNGPIATIPMTVGAFVKNVYAMDFDGGLLTKMKVDKPSQALGFLSIFPDALKEIASIPASLFPIQVHYSSEAEAEATQAAALAEMGSGEPIVIRRTSREGPRVSGVTPKNREGPMVELFRWFQGGR